MKLEELKGNREVLKIMVDYLYTDFETGKRKEALNDVGYTQADIDECGKIIDEYIDNLININLIKENKSNEKIMKCVEAVIIKLNDLNEKCDFDLIETDASEELVPFIINVAKLAGLISSDNDITEKWREW